MKQTDLKAIIVDCEGIALSEAEKDLFAREKPAGFILFQRNCENREQVYRLTSEMRDAVGADVPVLIDQEGGSVARLRQPVWRESEPARVFGELADVDMGKAVEATRLSAFLMAQELTEIGVTVNCAPVVDVPAPDCHEFLSASRTFHRDPDIVAKLGEAVCYGLLDGAVTPVIKHIPGHGRARVDSHFGLPVVEESFENMVNTDFKPFKYLAQSDLHTALWAMAAHVVYSAIDSDSAASVSSRVVHDVIRGEMGFDGVLIADDISMKALGGTLQSRVETTMAAGMDLTMLCNASFEDRKEALAATPTINDDAAHRLDRAERERQKRRQDIDGAEAEDKLAELLKKRNVA